MKVRKQRGSLFESMKDVVEIDNTLDDLFMFIKEDLKYYSSIKLLKEDIKVSHCCFDARSGWDTYIITVKGYGVFGFTDSPLKEHNPSREEGER